MKLGGNLLSLQLQHLNVYIRIYSELGRGKFGVVHLVEEKETKKLLAAKCIRTRKKVNFNNEHPSSSLSILTCITARQRSSRRGDLYSQRTGPQQDNQVRGQLLQQDGGGHTDGVPRWW